MNLQKIEDFAKKHTVLVIAGVGGVIIAVILILRGQSSKRVSLSTIHDDIAQVDFDINAMDTDVQNLNNFQPTPTTPVTTITPAPVTKPTTDTDTAQDAVEREAAQDKTGTTKKKSTDKDKKKAKGAGIGGYISSTTDPWEVFDSWAYVGEEDYRTLYEVIFPQEGYGLVDNFSNSIRLN